ncbi:MAG: phosphoribosyltransferase [Isosphaeraceae bacterium]
MYAGQSPNPRIRFRDRADAGRILAEELMGYAGRSDVLVLALPRGGVPVGYQVARALRAPLDIFLVRKLGVPGYEELAMGAIASGGVTVLNQSVINTLEIPADLIEETASRELAELERRERLYRRDRAPLNVVGKTVILVDDGLATGSTMRAAIAALRRLRPARIVAAVPTSAASTCAEIRALADACICTQTPEPFHAVGLWYDDFGQTTDEEVCELLARGNPRPTATAGR